MQLNVRITATGTSLSSIDQQNSRIFKVFLSYIIRLKLLLRKFHQIFVKFKQCRINRNDSYCILYHSQLGKEHHKGEQPRYFVFVEEQRRDGDDACFQACAADMWIVFALWRRRWLEIKSNMQYLCYILCIPFSSVIVNKAMFVEL
jgi:hypothetical protein